MSVKLSKEILEIIIGHLENIEDMGPMNAGWQSEELMSLINGLRELIDNADINY